MRKKQKKNKQKDFDIDKLIVTKGNTAVPTPTNAATLLN